MRILDPVANEKLYNLQHPIAPDSRMRYKKDTIKGTIGMFFIFTGNTRKVGLSKEVRTGLLEAPKPSESSR